MRLSQTTWERLACWLFAAILWAFVIWGFATLPDSHSTTAVASMEVR